MPGQNNIPDAFDTGDKGVGRLAARPLAGGRIDSVGALRGPA